MGSRGVQRGAAPVAVGLVGAGRWGQRIIATLRDLPGVELVAVCSRTKPVLEGQRFEAFEDWQGLVESDLCDALIVASPPDTHVPIALRALEANVAVMIEKPLALSLNEANQLHEYVTGRESCPPIVVDHTHIFAPAYQKLKALIRSPVVKIQSRGCSYEPWRPYSSLFDFGPHDLSMVLDLLGAMPDHVHNAVIREVRHETPGGTRTHKLFEIDMTFGAIQASCRVGNAAPTKERSLEVLCQNGDRLVYDDLRMEDKLRFNDAPIAVSGDKPLTVALTVLRDVTRGRPDPRCGLELAMRVQAVLDMCAKMEK